MPGGCTRKYADPCNNFFTYISALFLLVCLHNGGTRRDVIGGPVVLGKADIALRQGA